jgi:hypothetical protein
VPILIKKGAYLGGCTPQIGNSINNLEANVKTVDQPVSINAYPNPFSNHITLTFKVTKSGLANLSIYDMNGKLVSTLFNKKAEKDILYTTNFNATKLAASVYLCRLQTNAGIAQQKIVLRK